MKKKIKLFSLFGFKIQLHSSWILLALLVWWSLSAGYFPSIQGGLNTSSYVIMGIVGVIGLFGSIVFHEFFHSVVARFYDIPMGGITLFIFGGIAEMNDEPPTPKSEGFMAVAGPLSSLVLFLLFGYLFSLGTQANWNTSITTILLYLSELNFILAVFNMVPAFPLDGGRVLRSILWALKDDRRWATKWSSRIGTGFGTLLIALGFVAIIGNSFLGGIWWILIGLFLTHLASSSYSQLIIKEILQKENIQNYLNSDSSVRLKKGLNIETVVNEYFYKYYQKHFPVVDENRLIGCLSTKDIRKIPNEKRKDTKVEQVMHLCSDDEKIEVDSDAYKAFNKMLKNHRQDLVVVDKDQFVGILKWDEIIKNLSIKMDIEEDKKLPLAG